MKLPFLGLFITYIINNSLYYETYKKDNTKKLTYSKNNQENNSSKDMQKLKEKIAANNTCQKARL